jgi:hypothetical protein
MKHRCTDAIYLSRRSGRKDLYEGRPGTDQHPTVGQVLSMNANGRLTAPPQHEAVLATNSAYGMVFEAASWPSAHRGFSLDNPLFSTPRPASRRADGVFAQRAEFETASLFLIDPVTAPHLPSSPPEATENF